jgi:hypothetical protein
MKLWPLVLVLAACPGAGPPHGPSYTPENTPEAKSACPKEAAAAKKAREAALGEAARPTRVAAAKAIFAQAECERKQFDALELGGVSPDEFKINVDAAKAQFFSAQNLYVEAASYDLPEWAVAGYSRAGDLYAAYAAKLRGADAGPGVEGGDRALWQAEVDRIAEPVDQQAVEYWTKALDVVSLGPPQFALDDAVKPYVVSACTGLHKLGRRHAACGDPG